MNLAVTFYLTCVIFSVYYYVMFFLSFVLVPYFFTQKVFYPMSVLFGTLVIVQLFIIVTYFYDNLNNGS